MLALAFCCSYDVKIHYVRQVITILLQTHTIPEVPLRYRVLTRSVLRFIFRDQYIQRMSKCRPLWVILCRLSLIR
ncbi:hypothetical protein HanLR1_Chr02g0048911 [Helianthus annuus]|nr:hypothetical protein HanHA89_Chr02g0051151 [Helianthus annuus]KAJ0776725.1 hypothetical protein HanLR1_Chr02g0048911 [Helianthus annuus]